MSATRVDFKTPLGWVRVTKETAEVCFCVRCRRNKQGSMVVLTKCGEGPFWCLSLCVKCRSRLPASLAAILKREKAAA